MDAAGAVDNDKPSSPLPTTNPVPETPPPSRVCPAIYLIVWITLSTTVILFNNWILNPEYTNFQFPIFLTTWHLVFCTVATQLLAQTSTLLDGRKTTKVTGRTYVRSIIPIGVLFGVSLIGANEAYQFLSVPLIQMIKATTPLLVLLASWCLAVEKLNLRTLRNVSFIVIGVLIASYGETRFNPTGLTYQIFANIFEALKLVLVQKLLSSTEHNLTPLVSLYYFAPISAVFNFFLFLIFEGKQFSTAALAAVGPTALLANALVAFALNVSSLYLVARTSALVLTLGGVLRDILFAFAASISLGRTPSGLQSVGYCTALLGLMYYKFGGDNLSYSQLRGSSFRSSPARQIGAGVSFLVFLVVLGGVYDLYSPGDISHTVHGSMPGKWTTATTIAPYSVKRKFDIVVSMYRENQTKIASALAEIAALAPLDGLSPNIIIYVKDPDASIASIAASIKGSTVKIIPNQGREGGTYLSHIISSWDDLAEHTLFLQGDIHKFPQLKDRITDFFVPSTGVLSLGFGYSSSCSCDHCQDSWGGDDVWYRVPEIFSAVTGKRCPPASKILMSYGGQFIVSARRIRATGKIVYEHIQSLLESEKEHWIHGDSKMDRFNDRVDNPYFGHTLERSWMIMFQCTDPGLAKTCPKLDDRRKPEDVDETCQCLDVVV